MAVCDAAEGQAVISSAWAEARRLDGVSCLLQSDAKDGMIEFVWSEGPVPAGSEVRQVHGWLVDKQGRTLIQDRFHERKFLLAGGGVEV
jgi:hypothetical protein